MNVAFGAVQQGEAIVRVTTPDKLFHHFLGLQGQRAVRFLEAGVTAGARIESTLWAQSQAGSYSLF